MSGAPLRLAAPPPPRVWLKKAQAAEYLGVSERTLDNWRTDRGLPCHAVGNVVRFDRLELDAWFAGDQPATPEPRATGLAVVPPPG